MHRFSFAASRGQSLSLVTMLAATNDVITSELRFWDVNTAAGEDIVQLLADVDDGFSYLPVDEVLKVTITTQ